VSLPPDTARLNVERDQLLSVGADRRHHPAAGANLVDDRLRH
jgi:hypothetical protein